MKKQTLLLGAFLFFAVHAFAQQVQTYNLRQLLDDHKLEFVSGSSFVGVSDDGREAISFDIQEQVAWLKGTAFSNGEIELDLKGKDALQNSFIGVAFHGIDATTYDAVYFRPFNFQATDSVRHIHAVQYISHPNYPWERLRKEQNGKYEKAISPAPNPNDWFHARILVNNGKVSVYVNDNKQPSLEVNTLNDRKSGKVGIWLNGSFASFANLIIKNF